MNKTKNALLITLGHNSSAVYTDGVNRPIGFEEERLTKVKSESRFPINAIEKIIEMNCDLEGANVFVSHWFNHGDLDRIDAKYYDKHYMQRIKKTFNLNIVGLLQGEDKMTHHDAHMYSGLAFLEEHAQGFEDMFHIVADGFGNNSEVLSIYHQESRSEAPKLINRMWGMQNSLGLMYQFATSFVGMTEKQDEYKFLGYEADIDKVLTSAEIKTLDKLIEKDTRKRFRKFTDELSFPANDSPGIDFDDLTLAIENNRKDFKSALIAVDKYGFTDEHQYRTVIGYYVQGIIENFMGHLIEMYDMKSVTLSGGCFYNVKLNNVLLKKIPGNLCVMPLAGDQGAAIGMYRKYIGKIPLFDLCFGERNLKTEKKFDIDDNIIITDDRAEFIVEAIHLLNRNFIVNAVSGPMEFGPRALCNTSTLARPTKANVRYINMLNKRNSIMPMAPVILESKLPELMQEKLDASRVIGSDKFMAITYDTKGGFSRSNSGVVHSYPKTGGSSSRPQIIAERDQKPIKRILKEIDVDCIINTSFNTHGTPILYSLDDIIEDFKKQRTRDKDDRTFLLIYNGPEKH